VPLPPQLESGTTFWETPQLEDPRFDNEVHEPTGVVPSLTPHPLLLHVSVQSLLLVQQAPVGPLPLPRPQYPEVHVLLALVAVLVLLVVVLLLEVAVEGHLLAGVVPSLTPHPLLLHVSVQSLLLVQQAPVGPLPLPRPQYPEVHVLLALVAVLVLLVVLLIFVLVLVAVLLVLVTVALIIVLFEGARFLGNSIRE
jgi:hypothetical protein